MTTHHLDEAVLTGGIRNVNFFNGRLLSGEDLTAEQDAQRAARALLGQAIGDGIVQGLEVRRTPPTAGDTTGVTVTVAKGLAINAAGTTLSLPEEAQVALVRAPTATLNAGFSACNCPGDVALTGSGLYVLTICPAAGFQERAVTSGLAGSTCREGIPCGSKYAVSGVRFALLRLDVAQLAGVPAAVRAELQGLLATTTAVSLSRLRNRIAHVLLGSEARAGAATNPFAATGTGSDLYTGRSALATLRALIGLDPCAVPIALLHWTVSGIRSIDLGAVRRRALTPPPGSRWPLAHAGGDPVLGEAAMLQFQEHLTALRPGGELGISSAQQALLAVRDHARHLPAAGLIPLRAAGSASGFVREAFFTGITSRPPVFLEGARVAEVVREAQWHPPIDLARGEHIWQYLVRENRQAIDGGAGTVIPYLLFVTGQMPFRGEARFDSSYWDYAHYV